MRLFNKIKTNNKSVSTSMMMSTQDYFHTPLIN